MPKVCNFCNKYKNTTDINKNNKCKKCVADYNQRYWADNKEKISRQNKKYYKENKNEISRQNKKYYKENKDEILAQKKKYYKENKDEILTQKKRHYIENKDEILKYHKTYYKENKEEIAKHYKKYCEEHPHILANNHARRYIHLESQEITKIEWLLIMDSCNWRCFYCGVKLDKQNRSIDHFVPLAKGGRHSIENLVAACQSCNSSKKDKYYYQWKNY